ncbi:MAG TPA: TrkA C-terminal domain-containing protein, partial [Streptosporangiaceae bacterium]|nr:TrkA C-terminal domain-containing protein [Streptosporangiaceae bacterium]
LAVAIATATSRALSYGTIYTTKLLRRGYDVDRAAPWRAFADLKAADAMRPFPAVLAVPGRDGDGIPATLPGPVTYRRDPQAVHAGQPLLQTLRQLDAYGRDGLPVLSGDGRRAEGWITNDSVLQAVAREIGGAPAQPANAARPGRPVSAAGPPTPLAGYQVLEITVGPHSAAAGKPLSTISWPGGWVPVSVLRQRSLRQPDPGLTVAVGDRIGVLAPRPGGPAATAS